MVNESETLGGALEDLRAFCAVIEFGTVSAAARQLGETKGSVSRRVSRLERRLGTLLLARTPRAVSATEEGTAFYAKAREALSLLADAVEGSRQSHSAPQGHLRVTAPIDLGVDVLPELVVTFRARYPQITVELLLTDAQLDLASNRIDLALRASVASLPDMSYRASALIDMQVCLYAAPAYLAARGLPDTPAELAGHDLIAGREPVGAASLSLTHRRGRSTQVLARPLLRTSDYASAHRLVVASGGIGPIPDIIAAGSVAAGLIARVLPDWTLGVGKVHAISVAGREAPARVRLFRDFLRGELAERLSRASRREEAKRPSA